MIDVKGFLVPIGGAEDKGIDYIKTASEKARFDFFEAGILRQIVKLVEQVGSPRIELITTASSFPEKMEETYCKAFGKLGCDNMGHLFITHRDQVDTEEHLERIEACNCIIFTGGDQLRLTSILGGTELLACIKRRYQEERIVVAGTSAGAMAMGGTMIYDGNAIKAHLKGEIKFSTGFEFISNVIIDTHFEKRGRFNRLAQAVAVQPGILGIGLAEDTGMIITGGHYLEVIGSGIITILDGKNITYTNLIDISERMPISVENIVVHILSQGEKYDLITHEPVRPGKQ
ncbi:cyanophycinase [Longitalea arenae]|uniref:cyanophycinase n=1 Tax=Longitalea arenae TaxID=2812558 RepID=UPI001967EFD2|nr:cyanophycinase [Longitalea arenae]